MKKNVNIKVPSEFKESIEEYAKKAGIKPLNLLVSATYEYMLKVQYLAEEIPILKEVCNRIISDKFDNDFSIEEQQRTLERLENNILQFFTKNSGIYNLILEAKSTIKNKKKEQKID